MATKPRPKTTAEAKRWNYANKGMNCDWWPIREWPYRYQRWFMKDEIKHVQRFEIYVFMFNNGLNHVQIYNAWKEHRHWTSGMSQDFLWLSQKPASWFAGWSYWDMALKKSIGRAPHP